MAELALDYAGLIDALSMDVAPELVGHTILKAISQYYDAIWHPTGTMTFEQAGAVYLFDQASSDAPREDRTVAAWATTPSSVAPRDAGYQRGYPMDPDPVLPAVDRGHLIPRLSGGEFGPNIFRQDRALNRGWSAEGKRYRALERKAARNPGALFFGHLVYGDSSAFPGRVEIGVFLGGSFEVESFDNRPTG